MGSATLIDAVAADEAGELVRARTRYAGLLEPADPDPADADELRGLMDTLGKSAEDVRADHRTIQEARRLEATVRDGSDLDGPQATAREAFRAFIEQTQRIEDERRAGHRALANECERLGNLHSRGWTAVNQLNDMRHRCPELVGGRAAVRQT